MEIPIEKTRELVWNPPSLTYNPPNLEIYNMEIEESHLNYLYNMLQDCHADTRRGEKTKEGIMNRLEELRAHSGSNRLLGMIDNKISKSHSIKNKGIYDEQGGSIR